MFFKTFAVGLLCIAGAVTARPSRYNADLETVDGDIKVYAYGESISGLQIYSGIDGKAYIADPSANLTKLSWKSPSAHAPWSVSMNNNTADSAKFYIVTSTDAYEPAGFQRQNDTAPAGASMEGFTIFGSQVMWVSGTGLESKFWAQPTGIEGVHKLIWNVNNSDEEGSVPVVIKTMAPSANA